VTNEPSWDDIFASQPRDAAADAPAARDTGAPLSRRELRELENGRTSSRSASKPPKPATKQRGSTDGDDNGIGKPKRKRRFAWVFVVLAFVVMIAGVGVYGWTNYEPQIRSLLGIELPSDYEGDGTDEEVVIVIEKDQIGEDVARTLQREGVTMTFTAFYKLLLVQDPQVNFMPGNYTLHKEMSAKAALAALQDPANKVTNRVTIKEGSTLPSALTLLASATGLPVADFEAAAKDYVSLGVPATEVSLEGWIFPATYPLEPGQSAKQVLQVLVDEMISRLDAAGVAKADRHKVLTMAALIQREAGPNKDDFYKISRVFTNRLNTKGWKLQSDASVAYGTGNFTTVWTTKAERADASNKYNTYAHPGLPIGPIGLPGDLAIDAAAHPADGPWFFFVPINLKTGETVFTETADQHEAAAQQLRDWCKASEENKAYCE